MQTFLPQGTHRNVTEARVLRGFAKNIEHAALHCGPAGGGARTAYFDALKRAAQWEEYRRCHPRREN